MNPQGLEPIVALATPVGKSAVAVIRLSGSGVIGLVNQIFQGSKDLEKQPSHTIHFGTIHDDTGTMIDDVLVSLFIAPYSFTKEDCIEISCHGAPFIVAQIIQLLIKKGASVAEPGAFTKRAFLNGRFDLIQAEAVADLIAADSFLAHQVALQQMRGGFSTEIRLLREKLIHFAAMLELELDFAEEDVTFASRQALSMLAEELINRLAQLIESFQLGNVIKQGLPIVLVGNPNVGKSTLLNALLQEERAIVSAIPGTTRDPIEGTIYLEGIPCRFVDTAGLRAQAADEIEAIGIERTRVYINQAGLLLYIIDLSDTALTGSMIDHELQKLSHLNASCIKVGNKRDIANSNLLKNVANKDFLMISAKNKEDVSLLKKQIITLLQEDFVRPRDTIVVNARHYESLSKSKEALVAVCEGITTNLTNELLVLELRKALYHLGEITGTITTEDLLTDIFSKFCIGK